MEFSIPDDLEIITVVAIGYYGDKSILSKFNQKWEQPQTRKVFEEIIHKAEG